MASKLRNSFSQQLIWGREFPVLIATNLKLEKNEPLFAPTFYFSFSYNLSSAVSFRTIILIAHWRHQYNCQGLGLLMRVVSPSDQRWKDVILNRNSPSQECRNLLTCVWRDSFLHPNFWKNRKNMCVCVRVEKRQKMKIGEGKNRQNGHKLQSSHLNVNYF